HEVGVEAVYGQARDAELAALDLRVQAHRLAGAAEAAGGGDAPAHVGVEAEGAQVAQVDAGLEPKVGVDGAHAAEAARDLDVRVEDVGLQGVDRDVQPVRDPQPSGHGPEGDGGVALPCPA